MKERNEIERFEEVNERISSEEKFWNRFYNNYPLSKNTQDTVSNDYYNKFSSLSLTKTTKDTAVIGCILGLMYSFFILNLSSFELHLNWAIKGIFYGGIVGIIIYLIMVILRITFAILEIIFKFFIWVCIVMGVIYLFNFLIVSDKSNF